VIPASPISRDRELRKSDAAATARCHDVGLCVLRRGAEQCAREGGRRRLSVRWRLQTEGDGTNQLLLWLLSDVLAYLAGRVRPVRSTDHSFRSASLCCRVATAARAGKSDPSIAKIVPTAGRAQGHRSCSPWRARPGNGRSEIASSFRLGLDSDPSLASQLRHRVLATARLH
jgi:hypothetical protein